MFKVEIGRNFGLFWVTQISVQQNARFTQQVLVFWNPQLVRSIPIYSLYSILCSWDGQFWLCRAVTSLFWAFGTVPYKCYNSLKNVPIVLIFNMMRISSSAINSTKGVCFGSAVSEKLASKLALDFSPRSGWHQRVTPVTPWSFELYYESWVFWIPQLEGRLPIYILYVVIRSPDGQF